jgi:hypothetical protein
MVFMRGFAYPSAMSEFLPWLRWIGRWIAIFLWLMSTLFSVIISVYFAYLGANGRPVSAHNYLIVFGCLSIAAFIISTAAVLSLEKRRLIGRITELESKADTKAHERAEAVKACSQKASLILKGDNWSLGAPKMPFHAFVLAGGCDLESNEEIIEASNGIKANGWDHPFDGICPGHGPEKDLLAFMRHVRFGPDINPTSGPDYLKAANQWRVDHGYPLPSADEHYRLLFEKAALKRESK